MPDWTEPELVAARRVIAIAGHWPMGSTTIALHAAALVRPLLQFHDGGVSKAQAHEAVDAAWPPDEP